MIELYHIPPANDNQAVEQLIHVESEDTWTPRPRLLKRLGLPRFAPGVTLNAFEVRPDPAFAPLRADQPAKFGTRKPFTQDPAKGVLVFDISAQEPEMTFPFGNFGIPLPLHHGGQMRLYELFVLREYMNDAVESALQSESTEDSVPTTIWEDWGEEHSRMNPTTMSRRTWVSCQRRTVAKLTSRSARVLAIDSCRCIQTRRDHCMRTRTQTLILIQHLRQWRLFDESVYTISRRIICDASSRKTTARNLMPCRSRNRLRYLL